jgi:sterol desaturase/sphingolipid hydroxylase (fatty acid hydroxylase superfamily)
VLKSFWTTVEPLLSGTLGGLPTAILLIAAATALEFALPIERHSLRSRFAPFLYGLTGLLIGMACVAAMANGAQALGIRSLVRIPVSGFGALGDAIAVGLSLLFADFLAYWNHRFQHRFLWSIHAVHHSPTLLNAASGYAHFGEKAFRYLLLGIPLTIVDVDFPATPFVIVAVMEALELYIHSQIDAGLGPLGKILVDNRFHRIHHSLEPRHFNKNFAIAFSFWDRLFGTAYEPGREWPAVGIANNPPPADLRHYLAYPLLYPTSQQLTVATPQHLAAQALERRSSAVALDRYPQGIAARPSER